MQLFFNICIEFFKAVNYNNIDIIKGNYMEKPNWEERRYEIAKEVMASRVLGHSNIKVINLDEIAEFSTQVADTLINKLKNTENE